MLRNNVHKFVGCFRLLQILRGARANLERVDALDFCVNAQATVNCTTVSERSVDLAHKLLRESPVDWFAKCAENSTLNCKSTHFQKSATHRGPVRDVELEVPRTSNIDRK